MKDSVSPEQYKVAVLKQNMSRRFAEYEDVIAGLQTENAMLKQQLEAHDLEVPAEQVQEVAQAEEAVPAAAGLAE